MLEPHLANAALQSSVPLWIESHIPESLLNCRLGCSAVYLEMWVAEIHPYSQWWLAMLRTPVEVTKDTKERQYLL